jgi:hypothetical protein
MAAPDTSLPYGLRELKVATMSGTGTRGTLVALPNAQTLEFTEGTNSQELRGDDKVVARRVTIGDVEWTLGAGGIRLEAAVVMFGGSLVTSGTTPNEKKTYKRLSTDARPDFWLSGRALSESGGDYHMVFLRAKAGNFSGTLQDQEFWVSNAEGTALGSLAVGTPDEIYNLVINETAAAIV